MENTREFIDSREGFSFEEQLTYENMNECIEARFASGFDEIVEDDDSKEFPIIWENE